VRVQRCKNVSLALISTPKNLAMIYISRRIAFFNSGTLTVIKSVLTSSSFGDTARNELDRVDRHLAELASGPPDAPNAGIISTPKAERLQALLLSIFPEPQESEGIRSLLSQGRSFSGETVCQFIREQFSL
jgi:hypothetical protein